MTDNPKKFWNFLDQSETEAELLLYGPISDTTWFGDEITPGRFAQDLKNIGLKQNITVRINSGGGDVWAANAIYSLLRDNPANIIVKIDGIAASAATIIAMAGNDIQIPANGMMMIHDPMFGLSGYYNSSDLEQMGSILDSVKNSIIAAYKAKTGKDDKELSKLMSRETWMIGKEAVEMGFADTVLFDNSVQAVMAGDFLIVNNISHDLSKFNTKPVLKNVIPGAIRTQMKKSTANTGLKAKEVNKDMETMEELRVAFPELVHQIEDVARELGARTERERIKSIEDISKNISPALVYQAKFEQPVDARDLAFKALQANAALNKQYLRDAAKDTEQSQVGEIKTNPTGSENSSKDQLNQSVVNAMVEGANKKRR